ncbi:hypothetical protein E1176_05500 [Fulvivirga sp. RKSG066]|nr:hypothetical protein [Fulvivirga aurantia]
MVILCLLSYQMAVSQFNTSDFEYEPSETYPFGRLNPKAPSETADFSALIGECDCKSLTRNAQGEWKKDSVDMIWRFKYFMNGMAVQDETLKYDGLHTSSIRQYNADSAKWYVTFYSSSVASPLPSVWEGGKKENDIVLYRPQKAPNGTDGYYRLTFTDISEQGYNWRGEWVSVDESFVYPTWLIFCKRASQ